MPSVSTVSAWQPGSGQGSLSSSGQKARFSMSPAGPRQQHPLQLGQGPRRRRSGGGDQTRSAWLLSSCGVSHVAADQLQPSQGSSSFNSLASRLWQPVQPVAHMPRWQHQLAARQRQQLQPTLAAWYRPQDLPEQPSGGRSSLLVTGTWPPSSNWTGRTPPRRLRHLLHGSVRFQRRPSS